MGRGTKAVSERPVARGLRLSLKVLRGGDVRGFRQLASRCGNRRCLTTLQFTAALVRSGLSRLEQVGDFGLDRGRICAPGRLPLAVGLPPRARGAVSMGLTPIVNGLMRRGKGSVGPEVLQGHDQACCAGKPFFMKVRPHGGLGADVLPYRERRSQSDGTA